MTGADSRGTRPTTLLADADVLVDYSKSGDLAILSLVVEHVGPLAVVSTVFDEVRDLATADCARLGIEIVEATTEQLVQADGVESRVSFNDRVCLVVCREAGWTCVTNDRALQQLCRNHGVATRFGLGLLIDLAVAGVIQRRRAEAVVRRIQIQNPFHINDRVVRRFVAELDRVVRE